MSTSVMMATSPPKRPRPSGPRKQGPRQHLPSIARSTMSPAPEMARLVRNSPAPVEKGGHARVCLNKDCPGSDIVEDDMGGGLVCRACGTVLNESNIVAENQWIENPGGAAGMAGQFVGGNQAAPRTVTGMRNRSAYGPGHEGTDSRYQSEQKARTTMKTLGPIGITDVLIDQGVQIYKLAVQHGLLHGRTIELVAAVSAYVACRRNPKSNTVMLIDIADQLNINLFVLGSLYQKMVDKLKGIGGTFSATIEPVNPESLVNRFADHMEFGSDKIKIVRDAVHIFKRMKRDWITDGRRPAGIAAAAILLAARMNNYHRTVREMVLHAKLTEITINKRLWEFSNTEAAEWHVEQFRKMARQEAEGSQWEGPGPMSLPPIFYMQQAGAPKRPRGRPRKHPRPGANAETAAELEGESAEDEENADSSDEAPSPKRLRIDADGFKVPSLPKAPLQKSLVSVRDPSAEVEPELPASLEASTQQVVQTGSSIPNTATDRVDVTESQSTPEADDLFIVDQFEDGIMLTNDQPFQPPTESSIESLDAQQKMRVLDSIEEEASRAREAGIMGGTVRPSLSYEEKQRRINNNLCLYCGWPGHTHNNCGAGASAGRFKKIIKSKERQVEQDYDDGGIPSIRLTPFSQQSTLGGSTLGDGSSTMGDSSSTVGDLFGDDYQSTLADDDMQMLSSQKPGKSPSRSQTPSSVTSEKRRGRPKGWKAQPAPAETAAELEMENELTGDVTYALTEGADPADVALLMKEIGEVGTNTTTRPTPPQSHETIDLTSEIGAASNAITAAANALRGHTPTIPLTQIPPGGVPVISNIGNTGTISLSPTLSATEFDDDPEVSTCILSSTEAALKEKIWVTENAEWLRKDHYKRISKELREAAMIAEGRDPAEEAKKKKDRRIGAAPYMEQVKQRRKERMSQTPLGSELDEDEQARLNAAEATYEMVNHKARTAFSRRFNQQSMEGIWGDLASEPSNSSPSASRTSKSPIPNRGSSATKPRKSGRISAVSTDVADPGIQFQPPDEDGPLGPTQGRSSQSLGASKREARRWAALRQEKDALGIPQKVSLPRAAMLNPEHWGSRIQSGGASQGSTSPTPDAAVAGASGAQPIAMQASRRGAARPRPQAPRARFANAAANASLGIALAGSRPASAGSVNSNSNPAASGGQGGAVDDAMEEDTDSPLSSSVHSSIRVGGVPGATPNTTAGGKSAVDPDENMSSASDDDEDDEDDDEEELDEEDLEDPEDAFAGRVRRRSSTGSGESME